MKPVFRKWGHQGEEAYDSEEVSIQPDEGLQPPRPAGFIQAMVDTAKVEGRM